MDSKDLYNALKVTAQEINEHNQELGFYALRKVAALSENSPIVSLVRAADDLMLIASKINTRKDKDHE